MFARKFKQSLLNVLKDLEDEIIDHWRAHKSPYWFFLHKEAYVRGRATRDQEIAAAVSWIMKGAKGCNCYGEALVLQDKTARLLATLGALDACNKIILETIGNANLQENLLNKKIRMLLVEKGV